METKQAIRMILSFAIGFGLSVGTIAWAYAAPLF